MKFINFQCYYGVPDTCKWVARNQDGVLVGFVNPPVRDFGLGAWQDSVTGSYGEIIPFERWDVSLKETSCLSDLRLKSPGVIMHRKQKTNLENLKNHKKEAL